MSQPFVVKKRPYTVARYVVGLDLQPDDDLANRELRVEFVNVPNEAAYLHRSARIFPTTEPNHDGYDFIIVNPRTLDYVEVNILATTSYEPGETRSSFAYTVRSSSEVGRFPRQHQCPDVPNAACVAATCDVLGCKVGPEVDRVARPTDQDLEFLYGLACELHRRLDDTRIDFEREIRERHPGQALFVREGFTGSNVYRVDAMPLRRDPSGC